jgi:hypothetical protein
MRQNEVFDCLHRAAELLEIELDIALRNVARAVGTGRFRTK